MQKKLFHVLEYTSNTSIKLRYIVLIFAILFSIHSILMHKAYLTHGFDLGVYVQIFYLYTTGAPNYNTIANIPALANHFEPILFPLSIFFKLAPFPETLLILQAILVSLSAIPLFYILKDLLDEHKSKILTITYLTSTGILFAIHWDFHSTTISVLPLSLILFTWYFKKWTWYLGTLLLAILFKEDIPIFIAGLGLFQLISKQFKTGFATLLFAITSFYLIQYQITPLIAKTNTEHFSLYRISLSTLPLQKPQEIVPTLLSNPIYFLQQLTTPPVKLQTVTVLISEYLYLPLFSPLTYLTVFPYLFLRFTSKLDELWVISMHYNSNLQPFLLLSSALGYKYITKKLVIPKIHYIFSVLLIISMLKTIFFFGYHFTKNISLAREYRYIQSTLSKIPTSATVSAQDPLVPHLANREKIYLFPDTQDAQYIILDKKIYQGFYYGDKATKEKIEEIKNSREWQIYYQSQSTTIYKKI